MPKLVCVKCECEYKVELNGVGVVETASFGPYRLWNADLWKCPGCGAEVVAGFSGQGIEPMIEHYEPGFKELLERMKEDWPRVVYDNERPKAQ